MIKKTYTLVMDSDYNPLSGLPKTVRFQIMNTLGFMWSAVFSLWIGSIYYFGPLAILHLILLIGVFFTGYIFKKAKNKSKNK